MKSKYFEGELACKCGCSLTPKDETIKFADRVREEWTHYLVGLGYEAKDGQLLCVSGARCQEHNDKIKGAPGSAHLEGLALDLRPVRLDLLPLFHKWCRLKLAAWKNVGMEDPAYTTSWCHLQLRVPFRIFIPRRVP